MLSAVKVLNNDLFIHSYAMYHLQVIVPCTRTLYNSKIKKKILLLFNSVSCVLNVVGIKNAKVGEK